MRTIVDYNLFQNLGTSPGSHADSVQYVGTRSTNSVLAFNTITSGEEGLQLAAQNHSTLINTTISNNVIVAQGPSVTISYLIAVQESPGNTINGVIVRNNYLDTAGAYGPFYPPTGSNLTFVDNINMSKNARIANPPGTASTDVRGITPAVIHDIAGHDTAVTFKVKLDQAMFVTGTPTLMLSNGGTATYTEGSGTDVLTFIHTLRSSDRKVPRLAIAGIDLGKGAAIKDTMGNAANLTGLQTAMPGFAIDAGQRLPGAY
jgi:hypothetical protein